MQAALLFVEESTLQDWAREQNLEKGIAPVIAVVRSQRERQLNTNVKADLPKPRPANKKHRLQWLPLEASVAHQDGQDCGTGTCFCSRLSEQGRNPPHQTGSLCNTG